MNYLFEFDLEEGEVSKDTFGRYAIRYYNSDNGIIVEIGDGYRHGMFIEAKYWDKILEIIKEGDDEEIIRVITKGLMHRALSEEYEPTFISAIRNGLIKEIRGLVK